MMARRASYAHPLSGERPVRLTQAQSEQLITTMQPRRRGIIRSTAHISWVAIRWVLMAVGILCLAISLACVCICCPSKRKPMLGALMATLEVAGGA